jgi:hypothetical protein
MPLALNYCFSCKKVPLFGRLKYKSFVNFCDRCHVQATKLIKLKRFSHTDVTDYQKARRQNNMHFQFPKIWSAGFHFALLETETIKVKPAKTCGGYRIDQ